MVVVSFKCNPVTSWEESILNFYVQVILALSKIHNIDRYFKAGNLL